MKPSEMTEAQFERYCRKLWADYSPSRPFTAEPEPPDFEPWAGINEGEQ
jgi:hypothetical protein